MALIKQEILDRVKTLFGGQQVTIVSGEYDGEKGTLSFVFNDGTAISYDFVYKYKDAGITDSLIRAFMEVLMDTGGKIIKEYNSRLQPNKLQEFLDAVTEQG